MSWAIWITGPPGSGKSALARGAVAALEARGVRVALLELDRLRAFVTPVPTYSEAEREVVYRALAWIAATLTEAHVPVIVDATAHRREWRDLARKLIGRFVEVQLECPLEVCRERERRRVEGQAPRGIYARAGRPGATVPGVDVAYEPALHPELVVDTVREPEPIAVQRIVEHALALGRDRAAPARERGTAWAMWITGLPGSGKTTVAWRVAGALAARGISVEVLEFEALHRVVLEGRPESERARDILYRTLACTARLLTEAGVAVVVDAAAPRRVWRRLARKMIARFAEVQLVCPRDICGTRERATRWRLAEPAGAREPLPVAGAAPETGLDYEPPLRPDLILYTDVQNIASAAQDALRLANRLMRREAR